MFLCNGLILNNQKFSINIGSSTHQLSTHVWLLSKLSPHVWLLSKLSPHVWLLSKLSPHVWLLSKLSPHVWLLSKLSPHVWLLSIFVCLSCCIKMGRGGGAIPV